MLRAKAIQLIVTRSHEQGLDNAVWQNMQTNGLKVGRPLSADCFTLTSAMGLGGAFQTGKTVLVAPPLI